MAFRRRRESDPLMRDGLKRLKADEDLGVQIIPPADPPSWSNAPWWPLKVVFTVNAAKTVTGKTLHAYVLSSLSEKKIARTTSFNMRVQSVQIWGLSSQFITLNVYEPIGRLGLQRQLTNIGSAIHYSRLGWSFGAQRHFDSVSRYSRNAIFAVGGYVNEEAKVLVHVQLLIQISGAPAPKEILQSAFDRVAKPDSECW